MRKAISFLAVLISLLIFPDLVFAGSPPVQNNSQYTSPTSSVAADGTSTETISIHLQDSSNNPVVGDVVSLSSPNDSTATFPQNNQTTDSNGNATFTMATTTPGTDQINLFDSTNNVTFTNWFTVTFYDASKGCQNVPAAPILSSAVSNSNNTATLTWVDSPNPVTNYLVSYGIASKNYVYGDSNVGAQGTTSFVVKALNGNTKYYFAVSANNNCGTSGFSNEVSVVVQPIPATPAPTMEPTTSPAMTPAPDLAVVPVDTSTDTPTPTALPVASGGDINTTFRNLGIGVVAAGIVVIGSVFAIQMIKKRKNRVPPIKDNPPSILGPTTPVSYPQRTQPFSDTPGSSPPSSFPPQTGAI